MGTHLMLGNAAVARGAWEAGVQVQAAYPGVTALCTTPSCGLCLADKAKECRIDLAADSKLRIGPFGAEPWPESGRDRLRCGRAPRGWRARPPGRPASAGLSRARHALDSGGRGGPVRRRASGAAGERPVDAARPVAYDESSSPRVSEWRAAL